MAKKKPLDDIPDGVEIRPGKSVREALQDALGEEPPPKILKYRNKPTEVDGQWFASQREAKRWGELRLLEKVGQIRHLRPQVRYPLTIKGKRVTVYIADFVYEDVAAGREIVEDAKGVRTEVYKIKRNLMLLLRGITIQEV